MDGGGGGGGKSKHRRQTNKQMKTNKYNIPTGSYVQCVVLLEWLCLLTNAVSRVPVQSLELSLGSVFLLQSLELSLGRVFLFVLF